MYGPLRSRLSWLTTIVVALLATDSAAQLSFPQLQVGTWDASSQEVPSSNVVSNGVATPAYYSGGPTAGVPLHVPSVYFYFWLSEGQLSSLSLPVEVSSSSPLLTASVFNGSAFVSSAHIELQGEIAEGSSNRAAYEQAATPGLFSLVCLPGNSTIAFVTITALVPTGIPVVFSFNHTCQAGSDLQYLDIGTRPGFADVVSNGMRKWQEPDYIAIPSVESNAFFMWWTAQTTGVPLEVSSVNPIYDTRILSVAVSFPDGHYATPFNPVEPANIISLQASYQCKSSGSSVITVPISRSDGMFTPVVLRWTKQCIAFTPSPGPGPSGTPLSTAAIVFLMLFCIITSACIVGCGYNYCAKHKRGMEIIPGLEIYRTCWNQVIARDDFERLTPQDESAKGGYGGTNNYQDDAIEYQGSL